MGQEAIESAFGFVLAGFILIGPTLLLGKALCKLTGGRLANPWWVPVLASTGVLLLALLAITGPAASPIREEDHMMGAAFVPAWIWSLGGLLRHKPDPGGPNL